MAIKPYLYFQGNCREAVDFYADAFQTQKQQIATYGEVDNGFPMPEEMKNLVMHTTLDVSGGTLMMADLPSDSPYAVGNNVTIALFSDDLALIDAAFAKLSAGGKVEMPLQQTFWSKRYGSVTDKFGVSWQLSHEEKAAG